MNPERIGGIASIANAVFYAFLLVILVVLFPRIGFVDPSDWMDPAKGLAAWAASPATSALLSVNDVLMSIATFLTIVGIRQRLQADAPTLMTVTLVAGSVFSALWLSGTLVAWGSQSPIVAAQDASAYRSIMGSSSGLRAAAAHSLGWALLSAGWAAFKSRKLPRIPMGIAMVGGLFFLFEFVVTLFGFIGTAFLVVAFFWVGIALLKRAKD
jgi:hypothetical protein